MATVVTNVGMYERDTNGQKTTNERQNAGGDGRVSVWYQGIKYEFGPGQSKSFSDDGIASAVAAADGRLRVADTREGFSSKGVS